MRFTDVPFGCLFLAFCFVLLAWIGITAMFDEDYPITEDAVRVRVVAR